MSLTSYRAAPPRDKTETGITERFTRTGFRARRRYDPQADLIIGSEKQKAAARTMPAAAFCNVVNGFFSTRWLQSLATTYSSAA